MHPRIENRSKQTTLGIQAMSEPQANDKRLIDLEVKAALAEDLLDQLSQTVFRQQQQIEALAKEVSTLRQQMPQERSTQLASLRDNLPPHY
jgi:SlyX protein